SVLAVAAVASAAGYGALAPRSRLFGRAFFRGAPGSRDLALTFDDGPNDRHTARLLEVLAKHGARATFFLVGRHAERRPDLVRAIDAAGHAIGNHTFSHANLLFAPPARL